MSTVW